MNAQISVRKMSIMFSLILLGTCGCSTVRGPDRLELFHSKKQAFMPPAEYEIYRTEFHQLVLAGTPEDSGKAERLRNLVISQLLSEIDTVYDEYEQAVYSENIGFNVARDWSELGLSAAISIVGGEEAKTILGTALTAMQGATLSLDQNVYGEHAREAIISQMQASRATVRIAIIRKMTTSSPSLYTLSDGRSDAIKYLRAGTIRNALQHLAMEAGKKAIETQENLTALPRLSKVSSSELTLSKQIQAKYYKIADANNAQGMQEAVDILKAVDPTSPPPATRDAVLKHLQDVMKRASEDTGLFSKLAKAMKLEP